MRRLQIGLLAGVAMVAFLVPAPAQAAPITLDFTNGGVWGSASGLTNKTIVDQGLNVALSSSGGTLVQTGDGFGVDGPTILDDPGEVGPFETFGIGFQPLAHVSVYEVYIRQLIPNEFAGPEEGQYQVNGGAWQNFTALNNNGLLTLTLGASNVTSLNFSVASNRLFTDYSVAGLSVGQPVPEPASMVLLGTGLVGAGLRRLRRRRV